MSWYTISDAGVYKVGAIFDPTLGDAPDDELGLPLPIVTAGESYETLPGSWAEVYHTIGATIAHYCADDAARLLDVNITQQSRLEPGFIDEACIKVRLVFRS